MPPEKKLAPRRWYRLIPVVFITYSLAYLDRANFSFGAAGGMTNDLHITQSTSSLLGSLFFLGYFFFQVPGMQYAGRNSAKKIIFWCLLLWGFFAAATGLVSDIKVLLALRFLLGAVESLVFPSMVLLLSNWFTKAERSRANTFLIFGNPVTVLWMSVLSGYLINAVGWRWMFVCEGAPAIIWAFFWLRLADDKPSNARWLPEAEKLALAETLQTEQQGIKPVKNFAEALKSGIVVMLCLQYALWSLGVYGFVIWLPSIIKAAPGMDIVTTGWLSAIPYLMAIMGMLCISYFSDKARLRKIFIWPCLLLGAAAFAGSYITGNGHFWLSFTLLCIAGMAMYAPYGPFFALITEMLPTNVAGSAVALINSCGALGSFAGSYFVGWLNGHTGGFGASYVLMCCGLVLSAGFTIIAARDSKPLPGRHIVDV